MLLDSLRQAYVSLVKTEYIKRNFILANLERTTKSPKFLPANCIVLMKFIL